MLRDSRTEGFPTQSVEDAFSAQKRIDERQKPIQSQTPADPLFKGAWAGLSLIGKCGGHE